MKTAKSSGHRADAHLAARSVSPRRCVLCQRVTSEKGGYCESCRGGLFAILAEHHSLHAPRPSKERARQSGAASISHATPIDQTAWTVQLINCLKRAEVRTKEQVEAMTDGELLAIRGFGPTMLKEIRGRSTPHGDLDGTDWVEVPPDRRVPEEFNAPQWATGVNRNTPRTGLQRCKAAVRLKGVRTNLANGERTVVEGLYAQCMLSATYADGYCQVHEPRVSRKVVDLMGNRRS